MMRRWLLTLSVALLVSCAAWAEAPETLNPKLLRTAQIGAPQGISVGDIKKVAADSNHYDAHTIALARAALLVLGEERGIKVASLDEVLDSLLNNMSRETEGVLPAKGLEPGFGDNEAALTLVYGLVMSGQQERATNDLERHLAFGSLYKQAVILQALRNIGTPRAVGLIQRYLEKGEGKQMAQNTLADQDTPVLFELHDRWNLVSPSRRTRRELAKIVNSGCNQTTAMAMYWLAFFDKNPDAKEEKAELDALKAMQTRQGPGCGWVDHLMAVKALGMRSAETPAYWANLFKNEKDLWTRKQVALIAYARWGRQFNPYALEALKSEPVQYVAWELWHGNIETRQGRSFRKYWDIWLPVTLQFHLDYEEGGTSSVNPEDVSELLRWLKAGNRPRDPWVANAMLQRIGRFVRGENTRAYLGLFESMPGRQDSLTLLNEVEDPQALPLLNYWVSLPGAADGKQQLQYNIDRLKSRQKRAPSACCEPSEACLRQRVEQSAAASKIPTAEEAHRWLTMADVGKSNLKIRFQDELKRSADVEGKTGVRQTWEFLYGCWQRTDTTN
ncbi:MAG TPA: hypothetical protein VKT49_22605 [Bryobacteraceae bacterium]|nr:hypothetical protein [Bryobacteraceae bacterium]